MSEDRYHINIFKPNGEFQKTEISYIWMILAVWAAATYGFQLLLKIVQRNPQGESFLTDMQFLGFPFHYWFTGQFLIILFILLCIWFNILIDGLEDRHGKGDV
ncbi:MAG: DUF4212 domain-containing protein [Pseudomonadota bacterium]|nr:DUF4212 domain-containing protein [Pseudomonadota bacterium]